MKGNPWPLAFVFLIALVYLGFNNFQIPKIILGEKSQTEGIIYKIKLGRGMAGRGYVQHLKYIYEVEGKYYFGTFTIGKKYKYQKVGNSILLEYKTTKPEKSNVNGFKPRFYGVADSKYHSPKEHGFYEIQLDNSLFFYTEYGEYGKIIESFFGKYELTNDTLLVKPFKINLNIDFSKNMIYKTDYDKLEINELVNLENNRVYKK